MDTTAALIILVPILYPIVTSVGVNPIHFAMIICVNLAVGQVTSPFGCNLFVAWRHRRHWPGGHFQKGGFPSPSR